MYNAGESKKKDDGTALEVDGVVHYDHFQVQDDHPGSLDWPTKSTVYNITVKWLIFYY